ncbi:hypothetical protein D9M71_559110 [compost metagenome]
MQAQQPAAEGGAEQAAEQQPGQAAHAAVPQAGEGELWMAHHFDPGCLLPAAHDQGFAAFGVEIDQAAEPARHGVVARSHLPLDDDAVVTDTPHADAGVVAAVEYRVDHQLDHRRIVDVRGQRQAQRRGGVLGVRAQLADRLRARAFQAGDEAAGEGRQQKQADGDEQLLQQGHGAS